MGKNFKSNGDSKARKRLKKQGLVFNDIGNSIMGHDNFCDCPKCKGDGLNRAERRKMMKNKATKVKL